MSRPSPTPAGTFLQTLALRPSALRELGLLEDVVSDEEIIAAMVDRPIIVNRPIVAAAKGTRLCRPSEVVLGLLDNPPTTFTKEDGEVVVPS